MKNCKRPRMKNQERDFYQIPTDCSEEEIQRSCEFVKKVKELGDERTFVKFCNAMNSYQSKSLSYIDLKTRVAYILRKHEVLLQEFHQLLSEDLATKKKNGIIERRIIDLRDYASMKEEFEAFQIDFRSLKKPKLGFKAAAEEWRFVTPSYKIKLGAEEGSSSSSNKVLNEKYVSDGKFDPTKVKPKILSLDDMRMNDLEDTLLEEDRFLEALKSVVEFGNYVSLSMKFRTIPKRVIQGIIRKLRSMLTMMSEAKKLRVQKIYERQQRRNNVNN